MPKFFRRKRDPTAPTPGLEPAKVILSFVASLGDGAISVPGLKAAAQIAIKIIEVAQVRVRCHDLRYLFVVVYRALDGGVRRWWKATKQIA
jgi:hypothetical protein